MEQQITLLETRIANKTIILQFSDGYEYHITKDNPTKDAERIAYYTAQHLAIRNTETIDLTDVLNRKKELEIELNNIEKKLEALDIVSENILNQFGYALFGKNDLIKTFKKDHKGKNMQSELIFDRTKSGLVRIIIYRGYFSHILMDKTFKAKDCVELRELLLTNNLL